MTSNALFIALVGLVGLGLAGGPVAAQSGEPLTLPTPAVTAAPKPAAKPPAPRRIPLPLPRPANLGAGDGGLGIEPVQVAAAGPAPTVQLAKAEAPADTSQRGIVERANATLNAMSSLSAQFVQVGQNGKRLEGNLYVQKPGRMRFEYRAAPIEIVADGSSVAIRDRKLNTQDVYSIGQTPLKFLLKERVDLSRDTRLISAEAEPDLVSVTVEDKATFGGTSRVTLFFDPKSFALKQWLVVDPQGYETNVTLRNVQLQAKLDQNLFNINFTRVLE
ncbi:outer-membrane lipoprotein carrier protein [Alsobacter metallidurans]|uniref:Outer-membrane lipoprotein carrier protein n=1 Tax=Alsobacter metallidurans TaxID=340221 RepID=A0A917MJX7_9HYPH|nr:outer-membrane lipoprotein carrier protein LolA [Alsobacter metallidurans]GGH33556.1 outer-membrane lipoprotein carrier protein [Alsobacter metallidurans]